MGYRVLGLDPSQFWHLFGLADDALAREGGRRMIADAKPGFPDRIELRDLDPGETAILLNYEHQPADSAYRSRHAIFIREDARQPADLLDMLPEPIRVRPISLRAFSAAGEMLHAELASGEALEPHIEQFLNDENVAYLHAHYAKRGCYAAKIIRA